MNLQAYKFETIILENGVIKIPEISEFKNNEVEIIIFIKPKLKNTDNKPSIQNFIDTWSGFISMPPEDAKYNYLKEKYK